MNNFEIADILKLYGELLELHGEASFKPKAYSTAAYHIEQLPYELAAMTREEMESIESIGKILAEKITVILNEGTLPQLEQLIEKTPQGVLEMLELKGFGPKKISVLWKKLGIETLEDLLEACRTNKVCELKGFGAKTQDKLIESIQYRLQSKDYVLYMVAHIASVKLMKILAKEVTTELISLTGEMRRKCEVIQQIDILVGSEEQPDTTNLTKHAGISVNIINSPPENFYFNLLKTTGNEQHLSKLDLKGLEKANSEEEIYKANNLPFIPPEMREGLHEFNLLDNMPHLVTLDDIKGILHVHTTYSDGAHSLEKMALYCQSMGYEYLGICDHSQAAYYAGGLKPDKVLKQQQEIDELNKRLTPFRIFKGIESDILSDGSLDYPEEILKTFDFIVASIHSNLKMNEEKAMMRLLKAIENPYTTILGHMTGRMLLKRPGYPVNYKKVIDACAANNVIIEINANPRRLDMDWRWIYYALEKNVKISINPDAHSTGEYHLTYYGVCVARKGGLTKEMTFNTMGLTEVQQHFLRKCNKAIIS